MRLKAGMCLVLVGMTAAACLGGDYAGEVRADRPRGYWRLEEATGKRVEDASGQGWVGSYGAIADKGLTPKLGEAGATAALGRAADLATGAMGYFDVAGDGWNRSRDWTLELWLKPTRSGYETAPGIYLQTVASTVATGGATGWDLALLGDPVKGWAVRVAAAGRGSVVTPTPVVPHGVWSHLVVTVDAAGQVAVYVNGAPKWQGGPLPEIAGSAAPLRIGAPATPQWSGSFALCGLVDEVAYYERALPAERIAAHFGAAEYTPPAAGGPAAVAAAAREPYTTEETGEVLVRLTAAGKAATAELRLGEKVLAAGVKVEGRGLTAMPFRLSELPQGESTLNCVVTAEGQEIARLNVPVLKLPPKANEVKVDRRTGGVIVDGLPLMPFGFYCDADPRGLPDEEVVNGFNTIAPYWGRPTKRPEADFARVRQVMDRCAAVGMKVHYHVNDLGVQAATEGKWEALRAEVEAFRDHPALLAWYLADEPDSGVPFAVLEEARRFIRNLDPYHPVTLVLMAADRVGDYRGGADILMGDPYPIPHGPVTEVGEWMREARELTEGLVPLWVVPQAFGGGEGTPREPTAAEERALTYLPLINGARGVQYFVRRPPLGNPKSPVAWSECRTLAMEVAELTPALLAAEEAPAVRVEPDTLQAKAFVDRGLLTLVVVNTRNAPATFAAQLEGVGYSGAAKLPFENREVAVVGGKVGEEIDALGTRVYQFPVGALPAEDLKLDPRNLVLNPSWEENPSPGTPEGCYLEVGRDRGSSAMVDARLARHGRHCLRLTTATEGQGMTLLAFPLKVKRGETYAVSVWAKGRTPGLRFRLELPGAGARDFELTSDWREYRFTVKQEEVGVRVNARLSLTSAGTAWFDVLQVVPEG